MAGHGFAPKPERSRARDQKRRDAEITTVEDDGDLHGPELPEGVLPDGEEWHPRTVALWDSLRRFPTLADEPALGWEFLIDTALMHHTMWSKGKWEFAAEVRLRVAKYGATPEDRMRLKLKIATPMAAAEPSKPSGIADRRKNLKIAE